MPTMLVGILLLLFSVQVALRKWINLVFSNEIFFTSCPQTYHIYIGKAGFVWNKPPPQDRGLAPL